VIVCGLLRLFKGRFSMRVKNRLAEIRRQLDISAAELASRIGVTRQTIYAIEAQRYVPNTLVALRLSEVLGVPVERLFIMEDEFTQVEKTAAVDLLESAAVSGQPNQPIRVCMVGNRKIGVPSSPLLGEIPAADAIIVGPGKPGTTLVRMLQEEPRQNRILLAGCDPAMPLLARHLLKHGNIEVITTGCSSTQALKWLQERKIHIGGTHLRSELAGGSNLQVIEKFFPKGGYHVATFASWEEGLVVAKGNPKRISRVQDLGRRGLTLVNREVGAGSRYLLDSLLEKAGISSKRIRGYDQIAYGHILAAWHVHSGRADCCVATAASARVFGLDFIPLVAERFDLVIPNRYWDLDSVQILLDALNRSSLRKELEALGGYDTSQTGRLVN
jgi:putative molybdopterin biosynthesis protein